MPPLKDERPFCPGHRLGEHPLPGLLPLPDRPAHLDLGAGLGHFLETMAAREPQVNWVGLECDGPILRRAARRVRRAGAGNTLLFALGARPFLLEGVPPEGLDHIWINFPDPWPKKKHAPRRHAHPWMLGLLASRLRVGGELHLATDVASFAAQMTANLAQLPAMTPAPHSPWRRESLGVQTKYERKWQRLERPIHYADWRKTRPTPLDHYPFEWQPDPRLQCSRLPGKQFRSQGQYAVKIFAPHRRAPLRAGVVLIDRQTGITTAGVIDAQAQTVQLNGAWTPWKIDLLQPLLCQPTPKGD